MHNESNLDIREDRRRRHSKLARWMWILTIGGILGVILLFFFLSFQNLPTFEELENPKSKEATEVYAANGEVLGRYYIENRIPVTYDELSPHLVNAFVATEDERFYNHSGIDGKGLSRVLFKTLLMRQSSAGGASTITQQLAKMLFTKKPGSGLERVIQKFKEWIIALKLEKSYTKEEIITMYLNKFNFINGAYGIKAAAEIYFGTTQDSLAVEEAATLVGMLKNPSLFNPRRDSRKDTVKHRRMVVLKQMQKNSLITQEIYDSLRVVELDMSRFKRKEHYDGLAPYFRMELRKELMRQLEKEENRKPDGKKYDIFRDGLKVYTTLDPIIQKHAEESMVEHMTKLQKRFERVWKNKDPWTYEDPEKEPEEIEQENKSRKRAMKRLIRETDRYQNIRLGRLQKLLEEIAENVEGISVDKHLRDSDIERMLDEDAEKGKITRLVSSKMISSERAIKYKRILKSEYWSRLKTGWKDFQKAVETSFNTEVEMTVFAWEPENDFEKKTKMTPLDSIKYHHMFLQFGSMAVDPVTGHVKAWVGGINHKYFQYDHVTSERQVGSTFKPFVYATAIAQQGVSPCFKVYDVPHTIHKGEGNFHLLEDWTPQNANGKFSGELFTLIRGLQYSKNTVSVYLMKQLGDSEPVRQLINNMGISSSQKRSNGTYKIPRQPSICLGAVDLTVFEMTGAYTAFANNGVYNKPVFITRIEDKNGRIVYQEIPEDNQALHPNRNYVILQMLKQVMNQGLPGFQNLKSELGGKTGTTNDYVDGWFIGFSPDLVVGTWVGGEDRWIRFLSLQNGIGAKMARPFYAKLIRRLEEDPNADYDAKARFKIPPGDIGITLNCEEYDAGSPLDGFFEEDESFGDDPFGDEEEEPMPGDSLQQKSPEEDEEEDFGEDF